MSKPVRRGLFLVQRRYYEYWGMGITNRVQPYTRGYNKPKTFNEARLETSDLDSMYLTGSYQHVPIDAETFGTPEEQFKNARAYKFYRGVDKFILPEIRERQKTLGVQYLNNEVKDEDVFAVLLRDFPALATPLDAATQTRIMGVIREAAAFVDDAKTVDTMTEPVASELYETKFFTQPYWFRVHESIMEVVDSQAPTKDIALSVRILSERIAKIISNTQLSKPWMHETGSNPMTMELQAHRAVVEAGFW
eukprot:PhM_4_TR1621/c0_g1_i1/m.81367